MRKSKLTRQTKRIGRKYDEIATVSERAIPQYEAKSCMQSLTALTARIQNNTPLPVAVVDLLRALARAEPAVVMIAGRADVGSGGIAADSIASETGDTDAKQRSLP